jgi:large subunit ribosomal protein L4
MAAPKAPLLDQAGKKSKDVTLAEAVFGSELKSHLVHEVVRAEQNAARQGTRAAKSRGLVSGGRAKPWRQKGTGRARQGTIRAPQFTGGGVAFPPSPRSFDLKVNRKARKAAYRGALSVHAANGTIALVDGSTFDKPSTKQALALVGAWGKDAPLLVVATEQEESLIKSFRNLPRTVVTVPSELEVTALVWANSVLVTEAALEAVQAKAQTAEKEVSA